MAIDDEVDMRNRAWEMGINPDTGEKIGKIPEHLTRPIDGITPIVGRMSCSGSNLNPLHDPDRDLRDLDAQMPHAISAMRDTMEEGGKTHEKGGWRKQSADVHLAHAMQHLVRMNVDKDEDHAAHALCRLAMWVEKLRDEGKR